MANYFSCGFKRANILTGIEKHHSYKKEQHLKDFESQFGISPPKYHFHLLCFLKKRKWCGEARRIYVQQFSYEKSEKLDEKEKSKHSLHNCTPCFKNFNDEQVRFSNPKDQNKSKGTRRVKPVFTVNPQNNIDFTIDYVLESGVRQESSLNVSDNIFLSQGIIENCKINNSLDTSDSMDITQSNTFQSTSTPLVIIKVSKSSKSAYNNQKQNPAFKKLTLEISVSEKQDLCYLKEAGKKVLADISNISDQIYSIPFTKVITKIQGTNLELKKTSNEKIKLLRNQQQKINRRSNDLCHLAVYSKETLEYLFPFQEVLRIFEKK